MTKQRIRYVGCTESAKAIHLGIIPSEAVIEGSLPVPTKIIRLSRPIYGYTWGWPVDHEVAFRRLEEQIHEKFPKAKKAT